MSTISQLVYDILIGFLVLVFLCILVIPAFRDNMDLISASAGKVDDVEKIKADTMVGLGKGEVLGSDVISTIRYYSTNADVEITVASGGRTRTYRTGESYNKDEQPISYEAVFEAQYTYDGKSLKKAVFTEK